MIMLVFSYCWVLIPGWMARTKKSLPQNLGAEILVLKS
jgi:hypothetical protein